ncbi:MAG: hypothetical protein ACR2KX_07700 [Chitinophagaceae bacterium]
MKIYLLMFVLFFTTCASSQINDNPDNLRAKIFELKVKTIPGDSLKLPFESIKIIDSRPDTSKVGFMITRKFLVTVNRVFEKIMLKPGIEKGIENFYNEYYKYNFTPNGKVLLISIRKLWINSMPNRQGERQRNDLDRLSLQDIYAKFEYFLGSENTYVPLKRIDTTFQLSPITKTEGYDAADEKKLPFFCFALERMVENINYEYYIKNVGNKKKMSREEIEEYNDKTINIPILNSLTKKGVFLTFEEFKNNQPSILSFSKRKILKKKIYEILDEKDNVILHYFGYYDGEKLAIAKRLSTLFTGKISQDNYGIYRVGNSFQFFENHVLNGRAEVGVWGNNQPKNSNIINPGSNIVWVPRQIDMESGEIY